MRRLLVLIALMALTTPLFAVGWVPGEGPYSPNDSWVKPDDSPAPDWENGDGSDWDWDHRDCDGPSEEDEGVIYDGEYFWYWNEGMGCWVRVKG